MSGIRITQAIDNNQILVNVNTFNYIVLIPIHSNVLTQIALLIWCMSKAIFVGVLIKPCISPPSLDWKKFHA